MWKASSDGPSDPGIVMKSAEIGLIWAEHYSNYRHDHVSRQMCTLICSFLRQLARREIGCGSPTMRLTKILDSARIPIEQLEECEAEAKTMIIVRPHSC
jgi:hypothetical protein